MIKVILRFFCILLFYAPSLLGYEKSYHVDEAVWNQVKPYFLPENHPIKAKLDSIFSTRVSQNTQTLTAAGFLRPQPRSTSSTVVSRHPKVNGYILKLYTDDNPINDAYELMLRIIGAEKTRESILRHKFKSLFLVPKKWIYPLPANSAPDAAFPKNFILVAEDMNIIRRNKNFELWKSNAVSKKVLDALYVIVQDVGLDDSIKPSNIPFTKDHKFAFIDTAVFHRWPINFDKFSVYLSPTMQKHWRKLIEQNKP